MPKHEPCTCDDCKKTRRREALIAERKRQARQGAMELRNAKEAWPTMSMRERLWLRRNKPELVALIES